MKKVVVFFLLLTFAVSNFSFVEIKAKSNVACIDGIIAYVTVDGIEYTLRGNYPTTIRVSQVDWNGGSYNIMPTWSGYFYLSDTNLLCANLDFIGPNGQVTYQGLVYQ